MKGNLSMLAFKGTMLEGEFTDGELLEHVCSFLCDNDGGMSKHLLPKVESETERATISAALRLARKLDQTWATEGPKEYILDKDEERRATVASRRGHGERIWWFGVLPGLGRKLVWNESRVFHFIATTVYEHLELFRAFVDGLKEDPIGLLEGYEVLVIIEAFCHRERIPTEHAASKRGTKLQRRLWEATADNYDEAKGWADLAGEAVAS